MPYNQEVMELKRRYNVLREQNEKLIGSIKLLQATNESLSVNMDKLEGEKNKYKKAFDEIFTSNIGNAWEKFSDSEKANMSLEDKISFFNRESNLVKLYIRDKMDQQRKEELAVKDALIKELTEERNKYKAIYDKNQQENENAVESAKQAVKNDTPIENKPERKSFQPEKKQKTESAPKENKLNNALKNIFANKGNNSSEKSKEVNPSTSLKSGKSILPPKNNTPKIKPVPPKAKTNKPPSNKTEEQKNNSETRPYSTKKVNFMEVFKKLTDEVRKKWMTKWYEYDNAVNNISYGKEVLLVIGETGLFKYQHIFDEGVERGVWKESDNTRIRKAINDLTQTQFLIKLNPPKSFGVGQSFIPYALSKPGQAWYALEASSDPMESSYQIGVEEQKSAEHKSLIDNIANALSNAGFEIHTEVATKTTETGEESIADIVAHKGNDWNIRIECEMGNYSLEKYIYKFKKVLEVTDRLIVAVPDKSVKEHLIDVIATGEGSLIRTEYHGIDNFNDAGKSYLVVTLREVKDNPNIILPKVKKGGQ